MIFLRGERYENQLIFKQSSFLFGGIGNFLIHLKRCVFCRYVYGEHDVDLIVVVFNFLALFSNMGHSLNPDLKVNIGPVFSNL